MRRLLFELVFLFLVGLTPLLWYKPGYMALGHDMGFPLAPADHFRDRLFVWTERVGSFGANQAESLSGFFIHGFEYLLTIIGFSLIDMQKITFIFWFLMPGLSMYILLRSLHPDKDGWVLRLTGSLFYMMNHFLLQGWFIAERTKFSAAVALPLITLFTLNALFRGRSVLKNGLLVGLILFFFNTGPGVPLYAGLGVVVLCALLFFTASAVNQQDCLAKVKNSISFALISLLTFLLLNTYWIAPLLYYSVQNFSARISQSGGAEGAVNWSREISKNVSFSNLFRLQGIPDWYGNLNHPYANNFFNNPFLVLLSFLWPLLAFSSPILIIRQPMSSKMLTSFFVLLALAGMLFTAGSHPPGGVIYEFMLRNVPGFSVLRTPFYKFGLIVWFSYSYLVAVSLSALFFKLKDKDFGNVILGKAVYLIVPAFIILLAMYNYPYFTGVFFNWSKSYSTMVQVPSYIFDFKKWIDSSKITSDRILLVPDLDPNTRYEIYNWKYFSLSTIPTILTTKSVVANDAYLKGGEDDLIRGLYDNLSFNHNFALAKYLNIGHILIREDSSSPQNGNYLTGPMIQTIKDETLFYMADKFGEWTVYNPIDDKRLPVVYPSVKNTFINAPMGELSLVSSIPDVDLGDSFFITSSFARDDQLPRDGFQTRIIEGVCENCKPEQIEVRPPKARIFPHSNLLYFYDTWREKREESKIDNTGQEIDFLLGMVLKKEVLVEAILITRPVDSTLLPKILNDVTVNFQKIRQLYDLIPDQSQHIFYGKKINAYQRYIESRIDMLRGSIGDDSLNNTLDDLKWEMSRLSVGNLNDGVPNEKKIYNFSIPTPSTYKIILSQDELFLQDVNGKDIEIFLDGDKYTTTATALSKNWSLLGSLFLTVGDHELGIPTPVSKELPNNTTERSFEISSSNGSLACKSLSIGEITSRLTYHISFSYRTEVGDAIHFRLIQDTDLINFVARPKYKKEGSLDKESGWRQYETTYTPDKYTKSAKTEFCVNSSEGEDSKSFIDQFLVTAAAQPKVFFVSQDDSIKFAAPNISFVRINQTKYLISINNVTSPFFLNFNQRFDTGWRLQDVKVKDGGEVFAPQFLLDSRYNTREYSQSNTSLENRITYMGTTVAAHHFLNNGFANSWFIKSPGDYSFILEYEPQKVFYKAAIFSAISVVVVVIMVLYIQYKRKEYDSKI